MKKSPLSTPSGSKIRQNCSWRTRDYKNRTGYHYANNKSDGYQYSPSNGRQFCQSGNDFIPLSVSTPLPEQKRSSGTVITQPQSPISIIPILHTSHMANSSMDKRRDITRILESQFTYQIM